MSVSETLRRDVDLIGGSRLYVIKFEEPIFGGDECTGIITFRRVENNGRIGYVPFHVSRFRSANRSFGVSILMRCSE